MKKTNILLPALLAFVCLFAVSCDGEPANPAKSDVTPSVIDPVKDSELNVYQRIAEYLIDSGDSISEVIQESSDVSKLFGDISGDPTSEEAENARLAFLGIAFSINGTFDYLGDDEPYIEIGGTKYYEHSGVEGIDLSTGQFEINNLSLGSFSAVLDEVAETRTVTIKDLIYDIEVSSPVVHTMHVSMSAEFEFEVYYDEEDGEWYSSEDGSYSGSLTLDGRTWDSIEYDAEKAEYRYGEYVRSLWCTVKFDSKGGTSVETQRVLIGESADEPDTPKKNGSFIFMEWRNVKDDEPYDFDEVYEDIELYAAYYTPIPAGYEGEIHSMYKLSELLRNVDTAGRDNDDAKNLFGLGNENAEAYLFELMLLSLGKIDSYGSSPYYEIDGARYYLSRGDADGEGFIANKDYTYSISGTGSCMWSRSSDSESSSEKRRLIGLAYTVNIVKDGSTLKSIPVYIDFAYLEVESIFDDSSSKMVETSIVVEFDFDDESDNRVERSFKFDRDSNIGFYCDYYFDSSNYSQNL